MGPKRPYGYKTTGRVSLCDPTSGKGMKDDHGPSSFQAKLQRMGRFPFLFHFRPGFDNQFALIIKVPVHIVGMVPLMHGARCCTCGQCGRSSLIMGPSFISSGFRGFSFRMCHNQLLFSMISFSASHLGSVPSFRESS